MMVAKTSSVSAVSTAPGRRFLAAVVDETTRQTVRAVSLQLGWFKTEVHEGNAETILTLVGADALPELLLVDLSDSMDPIAAMTAIADVCGPETRVVAIGMVNDVGLYRKLLDMGVSEYLVKPTSRDALSDALRKASASEAHNPPAARSARTVALVGARGGVGVTTLAVSAAWMLAQRQKVILLDLDLHYGNASLSLDFASGIGLRDILTNPDRIDSLLVASAMTKANDRLQILDTEVPLDDELHIGAPGLATLLSDVGSSTDHIIIDTPRDLNSLGRYVLGAADVIAIVTDQSLAGMRDTQRLLRLVQNQRSDVKCLVIGNRAGGVAGEVARGDFERGIGCKIAVSIPMDMKAAVSAAHLGKSLVEVAKSPKTVAELQALALALGAPEPLTSAPSFIERVLKK